VRFDLTTLAHRAGELATTPDASEDDRHAAGLFLVVTVGAAMAGLLWGIAYVALGRPVSAAIPGGFTVAAAAAVVAAMSRHRLGRLRELVLLLMLLLPPLLQASLGGFVKGSAVVLWAFMAPLGALVFFGVRAAFVWLGAFLAIAVVGALLESRLAAGAPSFPAPIETAWFAFNLSGVAALVTLVLAYFRSQRDQAMARSESLLLNVLPPEIALRLKRNENPIADRFEEVSVLFGDLVGFTMRSATEEPEETVAVLNEFLSAFDVLAAHLGLRPIRTLGDSYVVVAGVPVPRQDHCEAIAEMALGMMDAVARLNQANGWDIQFRIGINTGPAIAAVVGRHRFTYDVWSDAVNTASRMESSGVPGQIQVTQATYDRLRDRYRFEARGQIDVKGKGLLSTYFLVGRANASRRRDLRQQP
jgi:adenylate cyclase